MKSKSNTAEQRREVAEGRRENSIKRDFRVICAKCIFLFIGLVLAFSCTRPGSESSYGLKDSVTVAPPYIAPPKVDTFPTINQTKLDLTKQYCLENYGFEDYHLDTPRIVIVHYTAIGDLDATLNLFKRDLVASDRKDISKFSQLNVGIHYVVAKDGRIFHLTPDTIVARHVIGLNHVALGIENVAADSTELTDAQIESNVKLISFLKRKHPTIGFVTAHHEYNDTTLPHFKYFLAKNPDYKPHGKIDPGIGFMIRLRKRLADEGLVFEK